MRIFSSLAESPRIGVEARLDAGGKHFEVAVDDKTVLARISFNSLIQMLERGDAANLPVMEWTHWSALGKNKGRSGGCTIYRADYNLIENSLWLVPGNNTDLDVLHFMQNKIEKMNLRCRNASLLASIESRQLACNFHMARLSPGSAITQKEPLSEQGQPPERVITSLSEDGSTLHC